MDRENNRNNRLYNQEEEHDVEMTFNALQASDTMPSGQAGTAIPKNDSFYIFDSFGNHIASQVGTPGGGAQPGSAFPNYNNSGPGYDRNHPYMIGQSLSQASTNFSQDVPRFSQAALNQHPAGAQAPQQQPIDFILTVRQINDQESMDDILDLLQSIIYGPYSRINVVIETENNGRGHVPGGPSTQHLLAGAYGQNNALAPVGLMSAGGLSLATSVDSAIEPAFNASGIIAVQNEGGAAAGSPAWGSSARGSSARGSSARSSPALGSTRGSANPGSGARRNMTREEAAAAGVYWCPRGGEHCKDFCSRCTVCHKCLSRDDERKKHEREQHGVVHGRGK